MSINRLQRRQRANKRESKLSLPYSTFQLYSNFTFIVSLNKRPSLFFVHPHLFHLCMTHGTPMTRFQILQSCVEVTRHRETETERDREGEITPGTTR